ncbi:hypothetical protein [Paenibacillus pini]|uniref:hypothetical protein n=1 Tax=Paenibacillus pini TaxID=669461 RepID=UPI00068D408B|nr:hypothetical protein [Paenibacillus pini]
MSKQQDTEVIKEAQNTAIQYLKDEYKVDVTITSAKKMPTYVNSKINMRGHVIGHDEQEFTISVDYTNQETSNLGVNPELEKVLKEKGSYPNIKKNESSTKIQEEQHE